MHGIRGVLALVLLLTVSAAKGGQSAPPAAERAPSTDGQRAPSADAPSEAPPADAASSKARPVPRLGPELSRRSSVLRAAYLQEPTHFADTPSGVEPPGLEPVDSYADFPQDDLSQPCEGGGCGDSLCGECGGCGLYDPLMGWFAGFEATFVQPRFEDNLAFTVMESDGASFESLADIEFDYDLELAPRAFVGYGLGEGTSMRATWWQFDHEAETASAQPPANGFGLITHPPFGDVDLSTSIPTDTYTAGTDLNAYTVDLELINSTRFSAWQLGVGCGMRYANIEQTYRAELRDSGSDLRGRIHFQHELEGVGPTMSVAAACSLTPQTEMFGTARGALLFGDGQSHLEAGEDLDLMTPLTTTKENTRDDVLPIGELQLGIRWQGAALGSWTPSLTAALEGQLWSGVGNAAAEDGNLGFFGFSAGVGVRH